jgi:uncharacterized protein YjeT (DUF2065 family)
VTDVSPDRQLPEWARVTGRILRTLGYVLAVAVGIGDVWFTSPVIGDTAGALAPLVWGWTLIIAGTSSAAAVVLWRWRWEWVCVWFLAGAMLSRATTVAVSLPESWLRLSGAACMALAGVLLLLRGLDLTIFAIRTSTAALAARRADA